MEFGELQQLCPTMEMVADELDAMGIPRILGGLHGQTHYRGVRPFTACTTLEKDLIYLICRDQSFPVDEYAYISTDEISGEAEHISCPGTDPQRLLDRLLELFDLYRRQETRMDHLVFQNGSLTQLCELAGELLDNPVCIHDDWFMMIARTADLDSYMAPEFIGTSQRGFISRKIIEEFKFDIDYIRTYDHTGAELWEGSGTTGKCMYVNLWQDQRYKGRILVLEEHRKFRARDFLVLQCIAQRTMLLLERKTPGDNWQYHSMDDIVLELLEGKEQDPADATMFLDMMHWGKEDRYLCVRLQNQQTDATAVLDNLIHNDLFRLFPGEYILFVKRQQCVVMNMTKQGGSVALVRHQLSPLCRDYGLYAGISSPVWGIRELPQAFHQADIALEEAFYLRNERWVIPFSTCALDVMLRGIQIGLPTMNMVAPELLALREVDQQKDTQYFDTLKVYLLCERDIPKASQALIIHRSTLVYRIKKITSLTKLNLDDPQTRLYLLVSLKLLEQEELKHKKPIAQ